jgi:hypothetical protein
MSRVPFTLRIIDLLVPFPNRSEANFLPLPAENESYHTPSWSGNKNLPFTSRNRLKIRGLWIYGKICRSATDSKTKTSKEVVEK